MYGGSRGRLGGDDAGVGAIDDLDGQDGLAGLHPRILDDLAGQHALFDTADNDIFGAVFRPELGGGHRVALDRLLDEGIVLGHQCRRLGRVDQVEAFFLEVVDHRAFDVGAAFLLDEHHGAWFIHGGEKDLQGHEVGGDRIERDHRLDLDMPGVALLFFLQHLVAAHRPDALGDDLVLLEVEILDLCLRAEDDADAFFHRRALGLEQGLLFVGADPFDGDSFIAGGLRWCLGGEARQRSQEKEKKEGEEKIFHAALPRVEDTTTIGKRTSITFLRGYSLLTKKTTFALFFLGNIPVLSARIAGRLLGWGILAGDWL